ncbi:MAG: NBR1-Ig-like domain-containing protein, partial [Chloroflexota bacterium]
FVSDVNYPDGTDVAPGAAFTKTWRLRNNGTCTWTSSYALVFDHGTAMGAPASVSLTPGTVAPGQTVEVSVNLTAPAAPGTYQAFFMLRNASGVLFGIGDAGTAAFWVKVDVVSGITEVYNFVDHYCEAEWRSAAGVLPCPGTDSDSNGFVIVLDAPKFENDRTEDEPALFTHPQWVDDGVITGRYPAITVQAGDRFRAFIGCRWKSGGSLCNVRFQLNYRLDGGPLQNLGQWTETYDGDWTELNIDLSALAGHSVQFALAVAANGSSSQDWALWLNPRIVR